MLERINMNSFPVVTSGGLLHDFGGVGQVGREVQAPVSGHEAVVSPIDDSTPEELAGEMQRRLLPVSGADVLLVPPTHDTGLAEDASTVFRDSLSCDGTNSHAFAHPEAWARRQIALTEATDQALATAFVTKAAEIRASQEREAQILPEFTGSGLSLSDVDQSRG